MSFQNQQITECVVLMSRSVSRHLHGIVAPAGN